MLTHAGFAPYGALFDAFEAHGFELLFVGGCVRDLVMGSEEIGDIDLATSATPTETKEVLSAHGFKVIPLGERFGTIATLVHGIPVEITTYRVGEVYAPGSRHPTVQYGTDITLDLGRRDLSINAMAMDRQGAIIDPYDGQRAIDEGKLEVPGAGLENTASILRDDPLRLLRIGRFAARFAFTPTDETTQAARETAPDLHHISHERWLAEWDKLLIAPRPDVGITWLSEVEALAVVFPEAASLSARQLATVGAAIRDSEPELHMAQSDRLRAVPWGKGALDVAEARRTMRWAIWLHALLSANPADDPRALARRVADRLKVSNARRDRWIRLVTHDAAVAGDALPTQRRRVDALLELVFLRLDVARMLGMDSAARCASELAVLLDSGDPVPSMPRGLGARLRKQFKLEGPAIGEAMRIVRMLVLDGTAPNGADTAAYVAAYAAHVEAKSTRAASKGGADQGGR